MYLFFRERGREEEREEEKHQCVVAFHMPPTGDLACKSVICPDWELNQRPFGMQAGTQSTEPHQQGLNSLILMAFSASVIFCFTSSTLAKCFPLRTIFIRETKKICSGMRLGEYRGWSMRVTMFLVKNC